MTLFSYPVLTLIRIGGAFILADIRRAQGRLRQAIRTYEQTLQLATEQGERRGTAELYLGLSELHHERGDLETARQHLLTGKVLRKQAALPGYEYMWCVVQARLKEAQGDFDSALKLLHEAERLYYQSPLPDVRPITALKTRMWIRQGKLAEALSWVRERGLSVEDDLSYLREYEHVTLAKILIAWYKRDQVDRVIYQAMGLLDRLLEAAEAGERTGSVIEILVVQALAYAAQGDIPHALAPLKRALTLSEPEGYVRLFVDEGVPMAKLLFEPATQGIKTDHIGLDYIGQLQAAFEAEAQQRNNNAPLPALPLVQSPIEPSIEPLIKPPVESSIDPLSERELEILQLIAEGFSNRQIGDRLFLALNTVKGHNRRIFAKLEVQRRTEAIARARELGLL